MSYFKQKIHTTLQEHTRVITRMTLVAVYLPTPVLSLMGSSTITANVWRSDGNLWELVPSFYYVSPTNPRSLGLGIKHPYQLSQLPHEPLLL